MWEQHFASFVDINQLSCTKAVLHSNRSQIIWKSWICSKNFKRSPRMNSSSWQTPLFLSGWGERGLEENVVFILFLLVQACLDKINRNTTQLQHNWELFLNMMSPAGRLWNSPSVIWSCITAEASVQHNKWESQNPLRNAHSLQNIRI